MLTPREKILYDALLEVKAKLCREVPDGYSQPCVDEDAKVCDAIIDAALAIAGREDE